MKNSIAKTFRTIFIVLAIVLLIITAVIYFVDAPVVEEGQEPTVAQKIILTGKKYLSTILLALGVSGISLLGVFAKLIYASASRTSAHSKETTAAVEALRAENVALRADNEDMRKLLNRSMQKQDIVNNVLLTTFSLAEIPSSLREKIFNAQSQYNDLCAPTLPEEQTPVADKNAAEKETSPVKTEVCEENKTEDASAVESANESSAPVYV